MFKDSFQLFVLLNRTILNMCLLCFFFFLVKRHLIKNLCHAPLTPRNVIIGTVKSFSNILKNYQFLRIKNYIHLHLLRSRLDRYFTTDEYLSLSVVLGLTSFLMSFFLFHGIILNFSWAFLIFISCAFLLAPIVYLRKLSDKRTLVIVRNLPIFVDYLSLAVGAGLDFNAGLRLVINDLPSSALSEEFRIVASDLFLGLSREDALQKMEIKLRIPLVSILIQNLIQAAKMGTELSEIFANLSQTIQTRRFQIAEEKAGKISVKMMIPMMIFLFPAILLILFGPMILEWMVHFG